MPGRRSFLTPEEHALMQRRMGTATALSPTMGGVPAAGQMPPGMPQAPGPAPSPGLMAPAAPPTAPDIATVPGQAALPGTLGDYVRQQQNAARAQASVPGSKLEMLRSGLMGAGLGGAATESGLGMAVGTGAGLLGEYLRQRKRKQPMKTGGVVKVQRLAAGGAAKERKGYPNTTAPKKRGMGSALRGAGKAQR